MWNVLYEEGDDGEMIASILPTFRRKVGSGFARGSTVEVGIKFSGRFEVKGLRENYFYGFIYIYFFVPRGLEGVINQSS